MLFFLKLPCKAYLGHKRASKEEDDEQEEEYTPRMYSMSGGGQDCRKNTGKGQRLACPCVNDKQRRNCDGNGQVHDFKKQLLLMVYETQLMMDE